MTDFKIKRSELEGVSRLKEMMKLSLGIKSSEEYFNWKYQNNPAGSFIGFEAYYGSELTGFYGVIPEYYFVNGKRTLEFQSMDTMVHPSYRKRGVFTLLAKHTYDYLKNTYGDVIIVGISGTQSTHGFVNKLNWNLAYQFSYSFQHKAILLFMSFFRKNHKLGVNRIDSFGANYSQFIAKSTTSFGAIYKDFSIEFMNWRVIEHPIIKYYSYELLFNGEVIGFAVCHNNGSLLMLDFVRFEKEEYYGKFGFLTLLGILKQSGSKLVYTWKANSYPLSNFQKSGYMVKNPFKHGPFSFKKPFIVYSSDPESSEAKMWNAEGMNSIQPLIQD